MLDTEKNIENKGEINNSERIKSTVANSTAFNVFSAKESNYEITLISENLLRIKISTVKSVSINCAVKDISASSGEISDQKTNNIVIHPKQDNSIQEIEIFIELGELENTQEAIPKTQSKAGELTPNPEVAFLIKKTQSREPVLKSAELILDEKLGRKNPFHIAREVYKRNMTRSMIASLILTFTLVFTFYGLASKKTSDDDEEPTRMLVLQDISEPKPPDNNIHDPVKPPEEKIDFSDEIKQKVNISKNVNPVKTIKRKEKPLIDTLGAELSRKLDSLEKIKNTTSSNEGTDTTKISKNLSTDSVYASYATFGIILNNAECSAYWSKTQYTPDFMKPGDSILTFVKNIDDNKKEQIQLYVYNKKFRYEEFKNKFIDENKFDIGDPEYTGYKVSEMDNENTTVIYYVKYMEKFEFTYFTRTEKTLLNDEAKRIIDLTVKSLRVSENKK